MGLLEEVNDAKKRRRGNAKSALGTRRYAPIVLKGVSEPKRVKITPAMFGRIDVDRSYQRDRISEEVLDIVAAIRGGGMVPDPVSLAIRLYEKDKKLWIIDGQQRTMAFFEMNVPFWADVYEVDSIETERKFFVITNAQRKRVQAGQTVRSWPGGTAELLRSVSALEGHPMCDKIAFKDGAKPFSSASLVRVLLVAMTGEKPRGAAVTEKLRVGDGAIGDKEAKARAEAILLLLPEIFHQSFVKLLPMMGVATVAFRHWKGNGGIVPPTKHTISRLRRVHWDSLAPSYSEKWLPVVVDKVAKIWV